MAKKKTNPTDIPASLKSVDVKAILRKRGIYLKQKTNHEFKEAAIPIARKLLKDRKKDEVAVARKYRSFTDEQAQSYWKKQIHTIEVVEQHFERKLIQFLNTLQKAVLDNLEAEVHGKKYPEKALKKVVVKDLFDDSEDDFVVQATIDFTPLLENLAVIAGQEAYNLIKVDDPYIPDSQIRNQILANVKKFATSMLETDQEHLSKIIADGIEGGLSVDQIRMNVTDDFSQYSKMQAERITRTEVLRTSTDATLDAYKQSGVVEGKQWLTAGAVDECEDYDGQIETLDGSFYSDTSDFADGDPPLHPNCRCVLLPVLLDEKSALVDIKAKTSKKKT